MVESYNPKLILQPETLFIGSLVTSHFFEVPHYQRSFQWQADEELEKLWDDLTWTRSKNFTNGKPSQEPEPHFLGAFVFIAGGESARTEIVDGQQRLTALTILARVMLDALGSFSPDGGARADFSASLTPWLYERVPGGRKPRLSLNYENDFYLGSTVEAGDAAQRAAFWKSEGDLKARSSAKRIHEAFTYFEHRLRTYLDNEGEDAGHSLGQLVDALTHFFIGLSIVVRDEHMAYRLFEALNFRGLDLSQADLLKSDLMRLAEKVGQVDKAEKHWTDMVSEVEKQEELSQPVFIQFDFTSRHETVKATDLYERVSRALRSEGDPQPLKYAETLARDATRLTQLVEGNETWTDRTRSALAEIRDPLGAKLAYPLLLAAHERFSQDTDQFELLVCAIRDFVFRYLTVGGGSIGSLSRIVGNASRTLRDTSKPHAEAIALLQTASPDGVFQEQFKTFAPKALKRGYYAIWKIEEHLGNAAGVLPRPRSPSQHLEHILPRSPRKKDWPDFFQNETLRPEVEEWIPRVGNLLVLERDINSKIKNHGIDFKLSNNDQKDYKHSKLALPHEVAQFLNEGGSWDITSIESRQSSLAELALTVWPLRA